jgi:hypothetical protein
MNKISRGLRNNNPLNIRRTKTKWVGASNVQGDPEFVTFTSMAMGYRAAMVTIRTYVKSYQCQTVSAVIRRWAPPTENNTNTYLQTVCLRGKLKPNDTVNPDDQAVMMRLVSAMSFVENGQIAVPSDVEMGWKLYRARFVD